MPLFTSNPPAVSYTKTPQDDYLDTALITVMQVGSVPQRLTFVHDRLVAHCLCERVPTEAYGE